MRERWVAGQLRRASALLVLRHTLEKADLQREWRSASAKLLRQAAEERAARERAARRAQAVEMVQQIWRTAWTRRQWQEIWSKLDMKARRERAQVLVAALVRRQLAKRIIRQRITHLQRMQHLRASLFEAAAAIVPVQMFLDTFRKRRQDELRAAAARRIVERYGTRVVLRSLLISTTIAIAHSHQYVLPHADLLDTWRCRLHWTAMRLAAVEIQRVWRGYDVRLDYALLIKTTAAARLILQSFARMVPVRLRYLRMKEKVPVIQRWWKSMWVHTWFRRTHRAARRIQVRNLMLEASWVRIYSTIKHSHVGVCFCVDLVPVLSSAILAWEVASAGQRHAASRF